ncbi:MAG: glycosyltransferase family 2 protein [Elusimicrobia bacterium]|nr:glycosyltransferase family 2 protein [Elusimicrobiota bacterium]
MAERASIIVLCHDQWATTRRCLDALRRATPRGTYEVLAYDNASSDETPRELRRLARGWPELRVIRNARNLPFAEAVNKGMRAARGGYLVWLNNDAVPSPGWLEGLVAAAESGRDVAAAGPMTDRMAPPQQMVRPFLSRPKPELEEVPFLGGFCFLLKRSVLEAAGFLDEEFTWGWEDIDYCLRLRHAGLKLLLARHLFVRHAGSRTLRKMVSRERVRTDLVNRGRMRRKWVHREPWRVELKNLFRRMPAPWEARLPAVSVIAPCSGDWQRARAGLLRLRDGLAARSYEVLAVDADRRGRLHAHLLSLAREWPELRVLGPWRAPSFATAANRAVSAAHGEFLAFVDPSADADASALVRRGPARAGSGAVVARLGKSGIPDAGPLIPRAAFEKAGALDERFEGALCLADYCLRLMQAGVRIIQLYSADAGAAEGRPAFAHDRRLAVRKWIAVGRSEARVKERLWGSLHSSRGERPTVSVVVLCRAGWDAARRCLGSVRRHPPSGDYEVVAAHFEGDARTARGLRRLAAAWPELRVCAPLGDVNFADGLNHAARAAGGDHLLILSDDALAAPGWADRLVEAAVVGKSRGIVAPLVEGATLDWQRPGGGASDRSVHYVRHHCLLVPADVYRRVGEFDDRFRTGLWAEDYCYRAKQRGFNVFVAPKVLLRRSAAPAGDGRDRDRREDLKLVFDKWAGHPLFHLETAP